MKMNFKKTATLAALMMAAVMTLPGMVEEVDAHPHGGASGNSMPGSIVDGDTKPGHQPRALYNSEFELLECDFNTPGCEPNYLF